MSSLPVLISIPAPELPGDLKQLAQLTTPDGIVVAYWFSQQKQVVVNYVDKWYLQDDCNIIDSVGEVMSINSSKITLIGKVSYFEQRGGWTHSDEITRAFYECDWSDYASDGMVFQVYITYPFDD